MPFHSCRVCQIAELLSNGQCAITREPSGQKRSIYVGFGAAENYKVGDTELRFRSLTAAFHPDKRELLHVGSVGEQEMSSLYCRVSPGHTGPLVLLGGPVLRENISRDRRYRSSSRMWETRMLSLSDLRVVDRMLFEPVFVSNLPHAVESPVSRTLSQETGFPCHARRKAEQTAKETGHH